MTRMDSTTLSEQHTTARIPASLLFGLQNFAFVLTLLLRKSTAPLPHSSLHTHTHRFDSAHALHPTPFPYLVDLTRSEVLSETDVTPKSAHPLNEKFTGTLHCVDTLFCGTQPFTQREPSHANVVICRTQRYKSRSFYHTRNVQLRVGGLWPCTNTWLPAQ